MTLQSSASSATNFPELTQAADRYEGAEPERPSQEPAVRSWRARLPHFGNSIGILLIHVGTVYAVVRGVRHGFELGLFGLAAAFYFVRMFAITGAYHRYFSHRTYKTSRWFQFVLALLGTTATQKGPIWWGGMHRLHHKHSDTERDIHSPKQRGFWYAHVGWWLSGDHEDVPVNQVRDLLKYPELRFLDRWHIIGVLLCMGVATLLRGWDGFIWGYVVSTFLLMHGTFTINSLAHVYGTRRYETTDTSRNNFWLALITMGEGWHNNHHHHMNSANQGFFWWEIDVTYYILKGLELVGLIWDVRRPPPHVLEGGARQRGNSLRPAQPVISVAAANTASKGPAGAAPAPAARSAVASAPVG